AMAGKSRKSLERMVTQMMESGPQSGPVAAATRPRGPKPVVEKGGKGKLIGIVIGGIAVAGVGTWLAFGRGASPSSADSPKQVAALSAPSTSQPQAPAAQDNPAAVLPDSAKAAAARPAPSRPRPGSTAAQTQRPPARQPVSSPVA